MECTNCPVSQKLALTGDEVVVSLSLSGSGILKALSTEGCICTDILMGSVQEGLPLVSLHGSGHLMGSVHGRVHVHWSLSMEVGILMGFVHGRLHVHLSLSMKWASSWALCTEGCMYTGLCPWKWASSWALWTEGGCTLVAVHGSEHPHGLWSVHTGLSP